MTHIAIFCKKLSNSRTYSLSEEGARKKKAFGFTSARRLNVPVHPHKAQHSTARTPDHLVRTFGNAASEVRQAPMLRLFQFHSRIIFLRSVPSAPAPPALPEPCHAHQLLGEMRRRFSARPCCAARRRR
jgi:hypothetical protein